MSAYILKKKSDLIGIISSGLCLIHCLFLPILITLLPYLEDSLGEIDFLEYIFLLLSYVAVYFSVKNTPSSIIKVAFIFVLALFTIGILFEEQANYISYIAYSGSAGLIVTHISNIRYCKKCNKIHTDYSKC